MKNALSYFTLFFSTSTLLCCALPALLVAIGAGGVMASLYANVPAFTNFVQNKNLIFIIVAVLLLINGLSLWLNRNVPCPLDAKKAMICMKSRKISRIIYFISLGIYFVGFFFSYLAVKLI